jgi:hypothetical protein
VLSKAPASIEPPPAACDAFVKRKPAPPPACAAKATTMPAQASPDSRALLASALSITDPAARDAALLALEACSSLPFGIVRALRAELAPVECGDVIAAPLVTAPAKNLGGAAHTALLGEAIAARIARASGAPPRPPAHPIDSAKAKAYAKQVATWMIAQLKALQALSQEGIALPYYAKALVAIEAGMAETRVIEAVRNAPIPDEFAKDREWQGAYYAALDEQLEPYKAIARDATLVGIGLFAYIGSIDEPRVARARSLLSQLYGGRKIDALDRLVLPALPPSSATSTDAKLAATLPTFYASFLIPATAAKDPGVLRVLVDKGISVPHRAALAEADTSAEARLLYARGRIRLGEEYFRALDFDQAISLARSVVGEKSPPAGDGKLLLALGLALRNGPEDASVLLRKAPVIVLGMGSTGALDAVASDPAASATGGIAAFDAALIRTIAPPQGADPAYFQDLAARWTSVQARVPEASLKAYAADQAKGAAATADAIK